MRLLGTLLFLAGTAPVLAAPGLRVTPGTVTLTRPEAPQRLLVTLEEKDGVQHDVTGGAALSVQPAGIVRLERRELVPLRNGRAVVTARFRNQAARAVVEVRLPARPALVSFADDVIPVFTRHGCNSGACHGAQSGKNGFRLSLLGYDPDLDHRSLLREGGARRVSRSDPAASLLLRKAAGEVPHAGGIRFRAGSADYRTLAEWIAEGARAPEAAEAGVARIEVTPAEAVLAPNGAQQLLVTAHYTDGASRDVTRLSRFVTNAEHLASVDADGQSRMLGTGEAVLRASFRGKVAVARLMVPSQAPAPAGSDPWAGTSNPVDQAIFAKLRKLRFVPSPVASDAEFLRRAYLDLTGAIPTPEQARRFLQSRAPDRRLRLVDDLLNSQEFVDLWTYRLGDLLRSTRRKLGTKGNRQFHAWIRAQVAANRPWDEMVREMLVSRGSLWEVGPANFYGTASGASELAEVTAQQFMGVRIQCARCHDHPFDRWTQEDYYRLSAYYARMQVKSGGERGDPVVVLQESGDVQHPRTGANLAPRPLGGGPESQDIDRRADLAAWLTGPENPWFARSMANRIWKHLMGRGLVDPVDDVRASNPPSNEAALEVLAQTLVRSGYDMRALIRLVATSRVYQLSAETNASNRFDDNQFSRHLVRRLTAEQLLDSLVAATGVPEKFTGMPKGIRAAQLPDTSVPSFLLDLFGRPARTNVCECEREDEPNLAQALHIMNGESINGRIGAPDGRLAKLLASELPDTALIEELFLATQTRFPTPKERAGALEAIQRSGARREAFADLFWALLNSREFLFTH